MRKLFVFTMLFALCSTLFAQDSDNDIIALKRLNQYRKLMGLAEAKLNPLITKAAQSHASYCVLNKRIGHNEIDSGAGFTGAYASDRLAAVGYATKGYSIYENIHSLANPTLAVDGWIDGVYHRLPLLKSSLEVGYGMMERINVKMDVMVFSTTYGNKEDFYIIYPTKMQKGVPVSVEGEKPNPSPHGDMSTGYPITMTINVAKYDTTFECLEHTLVDSKGTEIPHFLLTPETDHNKQLKDTIAIVPTTPLDIGQAYTVTIKVKLSTGKEFVETWSFTTSLNREEAFGNIAGVQNTAQSQPPDTQDPMYNYKQGLSKMEAKDYKGALEDFNMAVALDSNFAFAYSNRGYAKNELGDYKGAVEDWEKAIKINSSLKNKLQPEIKKAKERMKK